MKKFIYICLLAVLPMAVYCQETQVCVDDLRYVESSSTEADVFRTCGEQYSDTIRVHETVMINNAPHRVTLLREEAFSGLSRLRVLMLPATLTTVQSNVVYGCSNLEYVYSYATTPPTAASDAFSYLTSKTVLYVPSSSITAYSQAAGWSRFGMNILPIPRPAEVGDTLIVRTDPSGLQTRMYYLVLDTAAGNRSVRLIAPQKGYDATTMRGRLVMPDSVTDGVGVRYVVADAQANVLRGCTLLTEPVVLNKMLIYNGLGRQTDTVPTIVNRIIEGAYADTRGMNSLECLQAMPPTCSAHSLTGLSGKMPVYVSKTNLPAYQKALGWRICNLTPHLSEGDTITAEDAEHNYRLSYVITDNHPGRGEVRLVGGCDVMGDVVVPDSIVAPGGMGYKVVELEDSVLLNQPYIRSLKIGRNVRRIGHHAFAHAAQIIGLSVDRNNPVFHTIPGANAIIETRTGRLVMGCSISLITDGVTAIGAGAFCGQKLLKEINMPASMRTIETGAFDGCNAVRSVRLLCDVPQLSGDTAFLSICRRQGIEVLPQYVRRYQEAWPGVEVRPLAVPGALGDTLTCPIAGSDARFYFRITDNAIYHAEVMLVRAPADAPLPADTLILPDTIVVEGVRYFLTAMGDSVWAGATELKYVKVSAAVEHISPLSFAGLNLSSLSVAKGNKHYDSREDCNAIIETATARMVAGCRNTYLVNSLRIIGPHALQGCLLTQVTLPVGLKQVDDYGLADNPFTKISCRGFLPCQMAPTALDNVNRGISIRVPLGTRDDYAAAPVWSEFEVILEYEPHMQVGDVFEYTTEDNLTLYCQVNDTTPGHAIVAIVRPEESSYSLRGTVVIPDSVTDPIGNRYGVNALGKQVFAACRMDSLVLPATLVFLESAALHGCNRLTAIRCEAVEPPVVVTRTVFDGVSTEANIYVHRACIDLYQIQSGWQRFFNFLPIEAEPVGLDDLPSSPHNRKLLMNGRVLIIRDGRTYDILGRPM